MKLVDKNGKEIVEGSNVRIYQPGETYLDISYKDQEDDDKMAEIFTMCENDGSVYTNVHIKDNFYRQYKDGEPVVYNSPEMTFEREAFYIYLERDIPHCGVKKGDSVLVFGFEGSAMGVCRFDPKNLEVIS